MDEDGQVIKGRLSPCSLYQEGGRGKPCKTPEQQAQILRYTGKRCPTVVPVLENVTIMELGGLLLGDVPEAMAADFWNFYTRHMTIGERIMFGRRVMRYRSHLLEFASEKTPPPE